MKIGDIVEWKSQANGSAKTKTGVIVGVVPAGRRLGLLSYISGANSCSVEFAKYNTGPIEGAALARDHVSYLVAVKTGKTDAAKPTLYWPRVSALRGAVAACSSRSKTGDGKRKG